MTAMAKTATAMVTAKVMVMMLPLPPMSTTLMTTMAAIQGRQLDDGNWTMNIRQQRYASTMMATTVMAETVKAMATATEMATPMMPPPLMVKMSMKTTATIQGRQLDVDDWTM